MSTQGRDVWVMTNVEARAGVRDKNAGGGRRECWWSTGRDGSEGYARVAWRGTGKRAEGRNVS